MPEHLRQRLSDARRHLHPRLHRHVDLARAHVSCPAPPDRRARRHPFTRSSTSAPDGRSGAGAGPRIRTGQRTETQLPALRRAAPETSRRSGPIPRWRTPSWAGVPSGRSKKRPHGLAMAAAPRTEITFRRQTYCGERIRSRSGCASAYLPPVPTSGPGWSFAPDRPPPLRLQRLFSSFRNRKEKRLIFLYFLHQLGK